MLHKGKGPRALLLPLAWPERAGPGWKRNTRDKSPLARLDSGRSNCRVVSFVIKATKLIKCSEAVSAHMSLSKHIKMEELLVPPKFLMRTSSDCQSEVCLKAHSSVVFTEFALPCPALGISCI